MCSTHIEKTICHTGTSEYTSIWVLSLTVFCFWQRIGGHGNTEMEDAEAAHPRPWLEQRISCFQGQEGCSSSTNPLDLNTHTHAHTLISIALVMNRDGNDHFTKLPTLYWQFFAETSKCVYQPLEKVSYYH